VSIAAVGALAAGSAVVAILFAPLVRGRDLPAIPMRHPDAGALEDAGWTRGLGSWILLQLAAIAGAIGLCVSLGIPVIAAPVAALAPSIWIRWRAEAARDRAQRAVGRVVTTAEAALRSGMSLPDALRRAAEASADERAARPIRDALHAFDLGASLDAALVAGAEAAGDPRARLALGTLALGIGERLPRERLADLLGAVGERLAFEERLGDELRARAAGARQQQRLLAAVVPGLALYLSLTMPVLSATLGSDLGRFVLIPVAALLEVSGVVLGRRIVRGALG
jgi:Flp pilus assembly protein TadB